MPKMNGFGMYMDSVKSQVTPPGQTLKRNELAVLCAEGWKNLPEDEKMKFTEKAKRFNERIKSRGGGGGGGSKGPTPPKQIPKKISEDPEQGSEADKEAIEAGRQIVCQIFEQTDWRSQPIVVCHFSLYCEPDYAEHFLPAEIGLSTFSLMGGVTDNFSRIIEPGKVPQGYGIEAVHTAIKLGLPPLATVPEFADYDATMMIIDSYLQMYKITLRRGSNMYVFAFESEYVRVKRCFDWLFEKTGYRLPLKILSLDLWCYLSTTYSAMEASKANAKKPPGAVFQKEKNVHAVTNQFREKDKPLIGKFVYHSRHPMCAAGIFLKAEDVDDIIRDVDNYRCFEEMCCIYHLKNGLQIQYCALNMANRYAFSILEIITLSNEVPIIPGHHYPEIDKPPVEKARRYQMLRKWGITTFEEEMEVKIHDEVGPPTPPGRGFKNARERRDDRNGGGERRNRGPPRHRRERSEVPETLREDQQREEVEEGGEEMPSPQARAVLVRRPGPRTRRDSQGPSSIKGDGGKSLSKILEEEDDEEDDEEEEPLSGGFSRGEKGEASIYSGSVPSFFRKPSQQQQGGTSARR